MRAAIAGLPRFIVTPEVSKHRIFKWMTPPVVPDKNLTVIARADDTTFGILHSRVHELWSLGLCTWLGKGNDPRYTPTTTFETFPFPEGMTPRDTAAVARHTGLGAINEPGVVFKPGFQVGGQAHVELRGVGRGFGFGTHHGRLETGYSKMLA